jgi:alkylation response protein AidB-like acyl-CoA dehydrogenase
MAADVPRTGLAGRVAAVADRVLAPDAAAVDAGTVRRSSLDALATTGLFGMAVGPGLGPDIGPGVGAAEVREVTELLVAADAATAFVTAQHHLVARYVASARTGLRERLGPDLAAGRLIAGQGFSQLRRPGPPALRATRFDGGWRFDGTVPWYTGWGLNDVCLLAGRTGADPDEAVFAVVPAVAGPHLSASEPMALLAMSATRTVELAVDGLRVGDDDVARVLPMARWAAADARRTPNANPAVFGVARASLAGLAERDEAHVPGVSAAVAAFGSRLVDVRARAYRLLDDVPDDEALDERLELRVRALQLALDVTAAEVAASAGAAMTAGSPAQRHAREALFLSVQAQTADVRGATVAALAG